ncbi:uncharacterized protein LOC132195788 [Neocloeon triangulifer]|uniref:uncharacterized protein LOC132195788 n=1 Tax=Neocloeon triangulifer TaxID=2078957 RepID=UPI00286F99E6|nr:uncharacterized protein LOC132195788 [Neocloeon triangulifer]
MMSLVGKLAVFVLAGVGFGTVAAANGPTTVLDNADYPGLVMVEDESHNLVPGVFISRQYIMSNADTLYYSDKKTITIYGLPAPVTNVRDWSDDDDWIQIMKICYKFPGPFQPLTPSLYHDFTTNVTGTVVYYTPNGTLFGHTTDVLANENCPQAYTDAGDSSSEFNPDGSNACAVNDATDCSYDNDPVYDIVPALLINGVLVAFVNWVDCSSVSGLYNGVTEFFPVQHYRTFILDTVPDAIP